MTKFFLLILVTLLSSCCQPPVRAGVYSQDQISFLDAVRSMETGGHPDPTNAVGSYNELGPMQITWAFWKDAVDHDPTIGGEYDDVRDIDYSYRIADAYFRRWAPDEWKDPRRHYQTLGAIFNGGPKGMEKGKAINYASRLELRYQLIQGTWQS